MGLNGPSPGEPCHKLILVRKTGFDHLLYNFFLPITNGYSQFVTCIIGFVVIFPFCTYQEHLLLSGTHGYFFFFPFSAINGDRSLALGYIMNL